MSDRLIERVLAGEYADPDTGAPLSVGVRSVVIAPTLAGREAELIQSLELGKRLAIVSDPATHRALGARVEKALEGHFIVIPIRLSDRPHPDVETVEAIERAAERADALIAVGSGTINDLCKFAGARMRKPFAVFAAAPSMNGYVSANAAITRDGHKKTLSAREAAGVFIDLNVFCHAPKRLIRSGLGDSLCRSTAQADWLLAHRLFDQPYRNAPYDLLAEDEEALVAEPEALVHGDLEAMTRLARTLILSGFGMTLCGGSFPASQGEHLISHYIEMRGDPDLPPSYHGEQIAVTTLKMASIQERMLEGPAPRVFPTRPTEDAFLEHFGAELGESCWREFQPKRLNRERADELNQRLFERWDEIKAEIASIMRPAADIERALSQAGVATSPAGLGWSEDFFARAIRHARQIRNRYTFLDLADDAGCLDRMAGIENAGA